MPVRTSSITVGSRSTNVLNARGTCLPAPVSEKKVLNESSPPPTVLLGGGGCARARCVCGAVCDAALG